jgi:hypothetical protein
MRMASRIALTAACIAGSLAAATPALAAGGEGWPFGGPGWPGGPPVLYASPAGGAGSCSGFSACSLEDAVSKAAPGDIVIANPGFYKGGVVIDKQITLRGYGAVIDAASSSTGNGVQIAGTGSGSTVEGFRIEDAKFEGILVGTAPVAPTNEEGTPVTSGEPVNDVRITNNVLIHNGTGFGSHAGQCFSTPNAPGDCGETIHLVSVTDSVVQYNYVANNVGGILLTDEFGPTSGNLIRGNRTIGNTDDCGITLAGHNGAAVNHGTGLPTGEAGVFDNLVEGNTSNQNGVAGQGAGILLGGGAPWAGVYDNVIRGNSASGNGLSGVTIHQHLVGDLNGNVVEGNYLSDDNVDGDYDFAAAQATQTTGVLVASGVPPGPPLPPFLDPGPIKGTVIRGNRIVFVKDGIWTLGVEPASTVISGNSFGYGVTPLVTN